MTADAIAPETAFDRRRPSAALMTNPIRGKRGISASTPSPSEGGERVRIQRLAMPVQRNDDRETDGGFLDFVDQRDSAAAKTVDEENADRRELYALIAKKEGTKPEAVAIVNAKRNFDRAKSGEFLRTKGNWAKKA